MISSFSLALIFCEVTVCFSVWKSLLAPFRGAAVYFWSSLYSLVACASFSGYDIYLDVNKSVRSLMFWLNFTATYDSDSNAHVLKKSEEAEMSAPWESVLQGTRREMEKQRITKTRSDTLFLLFVHPLANHTIKFYLCRRYLEAGVSEEYALHVLLSLWTCFVRGSFV